MSLHAIFLSILAGLVLLGTIVVIWGSLQMRSFHRKHSSIRDRPDLQALKQFVKINMYQGLFVILLLMLLGLVSAAGSVLGALSIFEILPLLLIIPLCSFAGEKLKVHERKIKRLTVRDAELQAEFDHVTTAWSKQIFPDW